jgi:flagellar basal-body rod modification protein FlgD
VTSPTSSVNNGQNASALNGASSASSLSGGDSQNTFLKLLVTQLQNQDPINPMDSSQMTSQLAQINTVTGISQLNTTLASLASQLSAGQGAQLIGQVVMAPGTTATVANGASNGFGVSLPTDVTDLQVTVKDSKGNIVSTVDFGAQTAGNNPLAWTPTDASGNALPDGTYTISAVGTDKTGATTSEPTLSIEKVAGVVKQSDGSVGLLLQDGSTVAQSAVSLIL